MDVDQYAAARYGRLIEHAVLLGCTDAQARAHVDQVLRDHRRQIRRAEDPDPLVREALERAITRDAGAGAPTGRCAALGVVAVAVAIGVDAGHPAAGRAGAVAVRHGRRPGQPAARAAGLPRRAPRDRRVRAAGTGARLGPARRARRRTRGDGDGADRPTVRHHLPRAVRRPLGRVAVRVLRARWQATVVRERRPARHRQRTTRSPSPRSRRGTPGRWDDRVRPDRRGRPPARLDRDRPARAARRRPGAAARLVRRTPPGAGRSTGSALRIEVDRQTRNDEGTSAHSRSTSTGTGDAIDSVVVYSAKFQSGAAHLRREFPDHGRTLADGGHVDFDQYVAARYGRLIEHAVLLGCAEGEAGTYVDQVLLEQRKADPQGRGPRPAGPRGPRAGDHGRPGAPEPDRAVRRARRWSRWPWRSGVALTYRPPPEPMPSLFALDGDQAQQLLEDQGYDVVLRPGAGLRAARPGARLRPAGRRAGAEGRDRDGADRRPVRAPLRGARTPTAPPPGGSSRFALGGAPPEFAEHGAAARRRQRSRDVPRATSAVDRERWGEAFDLIAGAARPDRADRQRHAGAAGRPSPCRPPSGAACRGRPRPGCGGAAFRDRPARPRGDAGLPADDRPLPHRIARSTRSSSTRPRPSSALVTRPASDRGGCPAAVDVVGHHDRPEPGPGHEPRADHHHRQARPQVGVDVAGLVVLLVAEDAHQHQDHAVRRRAARR